MGKRKFSNLQGMVSINLCSGGINMKGKDMRGRIMQISHSN